MEDDKVHQLVDICKITEEEAKSYLEASNGDLNVAIGFVVGGKQQQQQQNTPASPPQYVEPPTGAGALAGQPPKQPQHPPANSNRGGITGFSDINKKDNPEDEKRNQFYAGGEKSGIAVLDPSKQNRDQLVDQVFETAQKHGAVSKSDVPAPPKDKFGGTGYTLGNNADESKVVVPKAKPAGLKTVILTFYTDCFTIDDGPPRKYQDPANAAFLNDVNKGVVPRELEAMAKGADLNIELLRKNEEYKPPPKPKVVAFSGAGNSVGELNAAPVGTKVDASSIVVDDSKPVTTIQVRLHDGSRLTIKCNQTHTIGDIKSHIEASHPTGKAMELRLSYPNKLLVDDHQTVQEAGISNASIIQRIF
jgi:UBX domain-containing protein 1